jgi:glycine betaine/choline ABC-type transport system substrate-binding protein
MRAPAFLVLLALVPACAKENSVVVGSKNFTEQVILGELLAQLLESRNVPVERRLNLGGTFICHRALLSGDLDLYVEYSGTALTAILKEPVQKDAAAVYRRVREAYEKELGLGWSAPLGFENTFAVVMKPDLAERLAIRSISDLKAHQARLRPGMGHEFLEREDGYRGFVQTYDLNFAERPRGIELGLIYQALMEDEVDFVFGNGTDGLIEKFGLTVLEDDRSYFPPYDAAVVYRPETLRRVAALSEVLALLEGGLDEESMRRLNRLVDDERRAPAEVVRLFIEERGWLHESEEPHKLDRPHLRP